jgi:hypothetical protein
MHLTIAATIIVTSIVAAIFKRRKRIKCRVFDHLRYNFRRRRRRKLWRATTLSPSSSNVANEAHCRRNCFISLSILPSSSPTSSPSSSTTVVVGHRRLAIYLTVIVTNIIAVIFKRRKHFTRRLVHLTVAIAVIVASVAPGRLFSLLLLLSSSLAIANAL